ncbi:class I SAM-dependent methyltransferase [Pseudodesulfovibrio indicus]|uniref:class I SAM-dependent methyltransferase n=1 Tax=Pseudodesulfovibrio indicus TaxID=1716143 RepID=UPI002931E366|nr:class I SAM-dependent methyltransferase [Pseudodesulfovibrio indicus]
MTKNPHDPKTKEFWNAKARSFPRFEEGEDNYEAGVLRKIRGHGVDFRGASVLDVGCGSGMYTLRLAREAARVTALDISEGMLDVLREDAESMGLTNIECVRSDWMDWAGDGTYDVVFCSMTPAIQSEESRLKLLAHAGRWTVFMGFAGVMESDVMNGLYAHYGVTPRIYVNGPEMREWLESRSIPYSRYPVNGTWVVPKSLDGLADSAATFLSQYGVTPDPDLLRNYLAAFEEEPGKFVERTRYEIDLLIWEKEAGA